MAEEKQSLKGMKFGTYAEEIERLDKVLTPGVYTAKLNSYRFENFSGVSKKGEEFSIDKINWVVEITEADDEEDIGFIIFHQTNWDTDRMRRMIIGFAGDDLTDMVEAHANEDGEPIDVDLVQENSDPFLNGLIGQTARIKTGVRKYDQDGETVQKTSLVNFAKD